MEKYSARSLSPSVVGDCFNMKWQHLDVALAMFMVKIEMYLSMKMNLVYVRWVSKEYIID
jgi:hypothetical protein